MAPTRPERLTVRPEPDQPDRLDDETERVLRERLADAGPTRPWDEFYAEEKKRKPAPPQPR